MSSAAAYYDLCFPSHLVVLLFLSLSLSISLAPSLAPAPATRPLSSGAKCAGDFKGPLCQMKSFPVSISEVDCVKSYWSTTRIVLRWLISLFCTPPISFPIPSPTSALTCTAQPLNDRPGFHLGANLSISLCSLLCSTPACPQIVIFALQPTQTQ